MATLISGSTGVNKITDGTITNADIASGAAIAGTKLVMPTGSVLQVVEASSNTGFATSATTYQSTGSSVTITPTDSASKILLMLNVNAWMSGTSGYAQMKIVAAGGVTGTVAEWGDWMYSASTSAFVQMAQFQKAHTGHNTTSAITYTAWIKSLNGATIWFPNDYLNNTNDKSMFMAIEIAG